MPSTHTSIHVHIVFGTKNREPCLHADWRPRLHEYIGGTLKRLEASPQGIGGMADHVHLLVGLLLRHSVAEVVREVKKASSTWIREETGLAGFHWQEGYAAFTVSPSGRAAVRSYIANQERHHRRKSFREEMAEILRAAGVEFEPEHLP